MKINSPINNSQDHGLWVYDTTALWFAPIRMNGTNPGGNILSIYEASAPGWNGVTAYSHVSGAGANFNQFSGVTTDQGALTISSGSLNSVVAAIPEPSAAALMGVLGAGIIFVRGVAGKYRKDVVCSPKVSARGF